MDIYILFMYPSTDAIHQEIRINSTSSCSLKLQVVSEGGIWAKLWLTHSVRAHFGSPESYHTRFISANYIIFTFMLEPILKVWDDERVGFKNWGPNWHFRNFHPSPMTWIFWLKFPAFVYSLAKWICKKSWWAGHFSNSKCTISKVVMLNRGHSLLLLQFKKKLI